MNTKMDAAKKPRIAHHPAYSVYIFPPLDGSWNNVVGMGYICRITHPCRLQYQLVLQEVGHKGRDRRIESCYVQHVRVVRISNRELICHHCIDHHLTLWEF